MKTGKLKIILPLLCVFFTRSGISYAQDWKADLMAMNTTYINAKSFSMDITVESYDNAADINPVVTYKGKVARKNENYFTTIVGKTTILNKRCKLVIDDGQKMILYKENKDHKNNPVSFFSIANLDSAIVLMTKDSDIKYLVNNANEKKLQIQYKGVTDSKVEITISATTNTLTRIIYYSEKIDGNVKVPIKTIVKYNHIKLNENIPDEVFSEKKYIDKKVGDLSPSKDYSHYELVN